MFIHTILMMISCKAIHFNDIRPEYSLTHHSIMVMSDDFARIEAMYDMVWYDGVEVDK
jgi:hypothetical protein